MKFLLVSLLIMMIGLTSQVAKGTTTKPVPTIMTPVICEHSASISVKFSQKGFYKVFGKPLCKANVTAQETVKFVSNCTAKKDIIKISFSKGKIYDAASNKQIYEFTCSNKNILTVTGTLGVTENITPIKVTVPSKTQSKLGIKFYKDTVKPTNELTTSKPVQLGESIILVITTTKSKYLHLKKCTVTADSTTVEVYNAKINTKIMTLIPNTQGHTTVKLTFNAFRLIDQEGNNMLFNCTVDVCSTKCKTNPGPAGKPASKTGYMAPEKDRTVEQIGYLKVLLPNQNSGKKVSATLSTTVLLLAGAYFLSKF